MRYAFDLDGTLFATRGTNYAAAVPIPERVARVRALIAEGRDVVFHTARGQRQSDTAVRRELDRAARQLRSCGLDVERVYPKVWANVYVDDRARSDISFFGR